MASTPYTGTHWGTLSGTPKVTWSFATLPGELVTFAASIGDPAYQSAVRKAFATWEGVAKIDFVEVADSLANGIRLGWSTIDKAGGTLASAHWRYSGQTITEAEIRFDIAEKWQPATSGNGSANFYATAVHEIGHAIGLAHVEENSSIMYPYQTGSAVLSAEDIAHVQAIYGAPASSMAVPSAGPATVATTTTAGSDIFRFYNGDKGVHFYTASAVERDGILRSLPQFQYEGAAFKAAATDTASAATVHRFFNAATGTHFYTANEGERASVEANLSAFRYEGAAFKAYADAGAGGEHHAVHRFLRTDTGTHFYTSSPAEKANVEASLPQYRYEGVAYYADWA